MLKFLPSRRAGTSKPMLKTSRRFYEIEISAHPCQKMNLRQGCQMVCF
jgi:hypothetical protein